MSRTRLSGTTHRLPFENIPPDRFEDLSADLAHREKSFKNLSHDGRGGNDQGVDILGVEVLADGTERTWFIQAKRYKEFTRADALEALQKALGHAEHPPDCLLLVIGCSVSRIAREAFEREARAKGVTDPMIWDATLLEAKLYSNKDLLQKYFQIGGADKGQDLEGTVKKNLAMKTKFVRGLQPMKLASHNVWDAMAGRGARNQTIIVRSVADQSYPQQNGLAPDASWFPAFFADYYPEGIMVAYSWTVTITDRKTGELQRFIEDNRKRVKEDQLRHISRLSNQLDNYRTEVAWEVGRIPYWNMVTLDRIGVDQSSGAHLYCRFAGADGPFDDYLTLTIDMDPCLRQIQNLLRWAQPDLERPVLWGGMSETRKSESSD